MKIKKETIAPLILIVITSILTFAQFTGNYPEMRLGLLSLLLSIAWAFERFKCAHLEHKLHKIEEAAKVKSNG